MSDQERSIVAPRSVDEALPSPCRSMIDPRAVVRVCAAISRTSHQGMLPPRQRPIRASRSASRPRRCGTSHRFRPEGEILEDRRLLTTHWTVTSTSDDVNAKGPLPDEGSLPYDISHSSSGDIITFDSSLAGATINLTTALDTSEGSSALLINHNLTIAGLNTNPGVTLSGGGSTAAPLRLFNVVSGVSLTLADLTLSNGVAQGSTGGGRGSTVVAGVAVALGWAARSSIRAH